MLAYRDQAPDAVSALHFLWEVYHEGAGEEFKDWLTRSGGSRAGGISKSFLELYCAMHRLPERQSGQGQLRVSKSSQLVLSDAEMLYFIENKFKLLSQIDPTLMSGVVGQVPWELPSDEKPSLWPEDYDVATQDDVHAFRGFLQQYGGSGTANVRSWPFFVFRLLHKEVWYKCVRHSSGMVGAGSTQLTRSESVSVPIMPPMPQMMQPTHGGMGMYPCGQGMGPPMGQSMGGFGGAMGSGMGSSMQQQPMLPGHYPHGPH
jgi:hypothetical protein